MVSQPIDFGWLVVCLDCFILKFGSSGVKIVSFLCSGLCPNYENSLLHNIQRLSMTNKSTTLNHPKSSFTAEQPTFRLPPPRTKDMYNFIGVEFVFKKFPLFIVVRGFIRHSLLLENLCHIEFCLHFIPPGLFFKKVWNGLKYRDLLID